MKWRVTAALVALTALVLIVQDVPLAAYLRSVESNRLVTEFQRDAFVIAGRSEGVLRTNDAANAPALEAMIDEYARSEGASVVVVNTDGKVVANSGPVIPPTQNFLNQPEISEALNGETAAGEGDVMGAPLLYVAVPVLSGPRTLGAVRITYPTSTLDDLVNERVRQIAIVAGLTMLAAIGIAFLLASTITRPIFRLQATTAQLASGDLTARANTKSGAPELRQLGRDLNTMAGQLSRLLDAQRSFAGDASHQLRTPLTALRLRLDQAAESMESSPAAAEEALDEARAETERLQHVIDGLLRLARSEGIQEALVAVNLAEIARERITIWEPLAEEHGVDLALDTPDSEPILAAREAAEQILDNYLDNALSVSPAGSTVVVSIAQSGTPAAPTSTLIVGDSGPGLSPDQRTRAFDRFWSMREDNAGTGLGLAIVRQLADASGAVVELRESSSGGIEAVAIFERNSKVR